MSKLSLCAGIIILLFCYRRGSAQSLKLQQGLLFKRSSNIRLGSVWILNKRSSIKVKSTTTGVFSISALAGDTIEFSSDSYQTMNWVVTDFADKVIYMDPIIQLQEVVIKENSIKSDIKEVQRGYREKSVFYTGTRHYYYLVLKPMTFIYENFKSEVIEARRFNRYARRELASYKVTERFNDASIKKVVPITEADLEDFELTYSPTLKQINSWSDYDLINYIKSAYNDFRKKNLRDHSMQLPADKTKNPAYEAGFLCQISAKIIMSKVSPDRCH